MTDNQTFSFEIQRHQFPVKLAMALTVHKAQGQTFDQIGMLQKTEMFAHGQLYVAVSRVKCWENIKIQVQSNRLNNMIKNIVYQEILEDAE
jgi:ATP-dependent exoDNAse (exonuclease V) alpha subunit